MDCDACNNLLLDLVYDELDEVRAAAVRRHAESCASCGPALARLSRGHAIASRLVPAEAPPVNDVLLQAVREAAARASVVPTGATTDERPAAVVVPLEPSRRVPAWLRRVGEVAMRRQVGMAAVLLLMIGLGLRFYQYHPTPGPTTPEELTTPDVVPATELPMPPTTAPPQPRPALGARRLAQLGRPAPSGNSERGEAPARPTPSPSNGNNNARATEPARAPNVAATDPTPTAPTPAANGVQSPAPYRNQQQEPLAPPSSIGSRPVGQDPSLERVLPRGPGSPAANTDSEQNAAQAAQRPPWMAYRDAAGHHAHRREHDQAIAAYRRAIELAPDEPTRYGLRLSLMTELSHAGRDDEARQLRPYLTNRPIAPTTEEGIVPPPRVNSQGSSVPQHVPARPSSRAPNRENDALQAPAAY